jgi:hypothetical protein
MAAGLGFKTFTTGEVLTAADTNGYLMQGVLVFASAAARDAAITSPQEGQCCYLKDTDAVLTYSGAAWVGFDDSNAIQNSIVDAKGDLVAASGADTPARLAVGNNGETLVADSSTSTGLSYQENYAAGKNKFINGDFRINQRAFTSTTATASTYGFDRWITSSSDGTVTFSAQTFTPGTAPVSGYEAINFLRAATTGQTLASANTQIHQRVEDVRTFAGQTITISFWAKAASGTPKIAVEVSQAFGTGGSPSSTVNTYAGQVTTSTSWARYSVTVSVPSISGKTIGTDSNSSSLPIRFHTSAGSDLNARTGSLGIQNATIDIWGIQAEDGSVATAFQTATGTIQGELAACQRYYFRNTGALVYQGSGGIAGSTTNSYQQIKHPVTMRVAPTSVDFSLLALQIITASYTVTGCTISQAAPDITLLFITVASGLTATTQSYMIINQNNAAAYLGLSAEL